MWRIFYEVGLIENFIFSALYHIHNESGCIVILGTHVDDLIWCNMERAQPIIEKLRAALKFGKEEAEEFTLCGKAFKQNGRQ